MRKAYYIASTHWDREWYETFQGFRWRLVNLLDEALSHLERDEAFASFEMDGQAVPVLDYLEVRKHDTERVRRLAAAGRFLIGPWFVLPDEWLVSGESLMRNLEIGLEITESFGAPRPLVAPLVDEFGHVSQMPQILAQLGFLGTSLHRGINLRDTSPNFIWQAPDGSEVLVHRLGLRGYGTLQLHYRRVLEADEPFDFEATVSRLVAWTLEEAERTPKAPILLLDSCDHVEIEPRAAEIIAEANRQLKERGIRILHSNTDTYFKTLSSEIDRAASSRVVGELRDSARDGVDIDGSWLIAATLSSRVKLKQANARCEDELCLWSEPFEAFASQALGVRSRRDFLELAWRYLLENHAHDSICGCSIDQVHKDMEFRFDQALALAAKVAGDSLRLIAEASAPADLPPNGALVLMLANATASPISGPVDFDVPLPTSWSGKFQEFFGYEEKFSFRLFDGASREVPWQLNGQQRDRHGFRRPYRKMAVEDSRHVVQVTAPLEIPAFGHICLVVEPASQPVRHLGSLRVAERVIENEYLRIEVAPDGTVALCDKENGQTYAGLFHFEDGGDIGDGWNWGLPVNNDIRAGSAGAAQVSIVADGPEKTTLRICTKLYVPEEFDFRQMKRSGRESELAIVTMITLRRGSRVLEAEIEVDNNVRDHRLRVFFPTEVLASTYVADSIFDCVERPIALAADNALRKELDVDGRPQQGWTAVGDATRGLGVACRGLYESGVADRPSRPLFLTLIRGFRKAVLSNDNLGGQSLGCHRFRLTLRPFTGDMPRMAFFRDAQMLAGGVRSVSLLPCELAAQREIRLPQKHSFFAVEGDVVVTSIRADAKGDWVVRFFNPTGEAVDFQVGTPGQFATAEVVNHGHVHTAMRLEDGRICGVAQPKSIVTVRASIAGTAVTALAGQDQRVAGESVV